MEIHKLVITGPAYLCDVKPIIEALKYFDLQPASIISAGGTGIDEAAIEYAEDNDIIHGVVRSDWQQYGRAACSIRNRVMAQQGNAALCLWDGEARGIADMITAAMMENIPVYLWPVRGED